MVIQVEMYWLSLILGGFIFLIFWHNFKIFMRRKPQPPGPWVLPIIGHLHLLRKPPHELFTELSIHYGPIFSLKLGSLRTVVITDAKLLRKACRRPEFSFRPDYPAFHSICPGKFKGIIFNRGQACEEQREFVRKYFRTFTADLKSNEEITIQEAYNLIESMRSTPLNSLKYEFSIPTLVSLWTTIMGDKLKSTDTTILHLAKLVCQGSTGYSVWTFIGILFPAIGSSLPILFKQISSAQLALFDYFSTEIEKEKKSWVKGSPRHFTDAYFDKVANTLDPQSSFHPSENNQPYTTLDLFAAGSEAVSITFEWMFLYMSGSIPIQDKFFAEIREKLPNSRPPNLADRKGMPYCDAVIKETSRLGNVVPLAVWHQITEDVDFYDYFIPKDTILMPNLYGAHNDPKVWGEDVREFRPERFVENEGILVRPKTKDGKKEEEILGPAKDFLIPYGVGRRDCPAIDLSKHTLFLFTATLFQKIYLTSTDPPPSRVPLVGMILAPQPFQVYIHERPAY